MVRGCLFPGCWKIQIKFLTDTYVVYKIPPSQIVSTEKSLESYDYNLYIPTKSELTGSVDTAVQRAFNVQYQNIANNSIWYELKLASLMKEEKQRLGNVLFRFPSVILISLNKKIKKQI